MNFKAMSKYVSIFIFLFSLNGKAQDAIDIVAKWKKNEAHSVLIKSSTTKSNQGTSLNYNTIFNANFRVVEKNKSEIIVEWVYSNAKLADNDPTFENHIIAALLNKKILIRLTETGKFVELINVDETRLETNKIIENLISTSTDNARKNLFNTIKQLIVSKQGLEIVLLKQIKFYTFSFGYSYQLNSEQINNIKFPNPLGGDPFDAIEKVKLTKLDTQNSICVIETSKIVDSALLKKVTIDYLNKVSKEDAAKIEKENVEMTERTMQQIDYSKGILKKSLFKRVMDLKIQNQSIELEIETLD